MRYFTVTGVSRLGVSMTTHEFIAEGEALLEDTFNALRGVNAIRGIRIRPFSGGPVEISLADKRGTLIKGRRP